MRGADSANGIDRANEMAGELATRLAEKKVVEPLVVRAYRPGDEEKINTGFNRAFGLKRTLQQWREKFGENGSHASIVVAVDEIGNVVAHCAALKTRFNVAGCEIVCGQAVDSYCLPEARIIEPAVFQRCMSSFYEIFCGNAGLPLLFGFPGKRHLRLGNLKLGYETGRCVEYYCKSPRVSRIWFPRFKVGAHFDREAMDDLWKRCVKRYDYAVVRDSQRLIERYAFGSLQSPSRFEPCSSSGYFLLTVVQGKRKVEAWLVYRIDGKRMKIIDFLWDGRDERSVREVLLQTANVAVHRDCELMEIWLNGDEKLAKVMTSSGWIERENPEKLMASAVSPQGSVDARNILAGFYYTWGDSDLV